MKIGSLVFATNQGLGVLAKDFYDNGIIDYVYVQPHKTRETNYDWYPDRKTLEELMELCDGFLFFETHFYNEFIHEAVKRGKKLFMMPMYECSIYPFPVKYDKVICPSRLDYDFYPKENRIFEYVPIPDWIEWKQRKVAKHFIHNAGHGGLAGRNGTQELIDAMKYVESPIRLTIRTQSRKFKCSDSRVSITNATLPKEKLYDSGDVFIFPEKFNGLSLPLQEAYASGMGIMSTRRYPIDMWLPNDLMIEPSGFEDVQSVRKIKVAKIDPQEIAKTIDKWYGKDISNYSRMGKEWGKYHSWDYLKSKYLDICEK